MKVPFPDISSKLAVSPHMYICKDVECNTYRYIKCQTLKPKMLTSKLLRHFVDETPDISRNPFQRATRIDCDKVFMTASVRYGDGLKTDRRPDVCQELYDVVVREVEADGYDKIEMDEDGLTKINPLITKIGRKM